MSNAAVDIIEISKEGVDWSNPPCMPRRLAEGVEQTLRTEGEGVHEVLLVSQLDRSAQIFGLFSGMDAELRVTRLAPGAELTLEKLDANRHEILIVQQGVLRVASGDKTTDLGLHDALSLRPHWQATLRNEGKSDCTFLRLRVYDPHAKTAKTANQKRLRHATARFEAQKPMYERGLMRHQPGFLRHWIEAFRSVLSPRDLRLMVGPVNQPGASYAVRGPDNTVVVVAGTPEGDGPALHIHRMTDEIFVVLDGTYEIAWGDDPKNLNKVVLNPLDTIAVPPGVNRKFTCLSGNGQICPIVLGARKELDDITFLPYVEKDLREALPGPLVAAVKRVVGLQFKERAEISFPRRNEALARG